MEQASEIRWGEDIMNLKSENFNPRRIDVRYYISWLSWASDDWKRRSQQYIKPTGYFLLMDYNRPSLKSVKR